MAKCIFENLSPEQAKVLAEWFEGQGEQDCEVLENGNVIVHCRTCKKEKP